MCKIGVFICNYNGKEWVKKCIDSLFRQTMSEFEIYVVDNASTDGTVQEIQNKYGKKVSIICNPENLGGAGGFDRGLNIGLEKGYKYIVLLDNDVTLDERAIENMKLYLEKKKDVGIVGAKVMMMDWPDIVQDCGDYLDFDTFRERIGYRGYKESVKIPEENICDYVPTCAVMIRSEVLKKSGTMPADNFIYYDDIELSYKIKLCGYKVVALGNVKVWHKGGFRKANINTFSRYYFLRNRLNFFAKYIRDKDINCFINTLLKEIFSQLYGYYNKGMTELFQTTIYALDDFLHEIRGKADAFKIMNISERPTPFDRILEEKNHIRIIFMDNFFPEDPLDIYHIFLYIVANIQKNHPQKKLWVSLKQCKYKEAEFKESLEKVIEMDEQRFGVPEILVSDDDEKEFDLNLRMCEHVKLVKENVLPEIYVDKYCNCITSEDDYMYFKGSSTNEKLFMEIYRPLMEQAIKRIRSRD